MLARAAELVGGEDLIAKRLGVTRTRLALWLAGFEAMPMWVFFELVDILLAPPRRVPQQQLDERKSAIAACPSQSEESGMPAIK